MSAIDFKLNNKKYTPLDESVFRLVGLGCNYIHHISDVLYIFSEEMIAKTLEKLVNDQLLELNLSNGSVRYSHLMERLYENCNSNLELVLPQDHEEDNILLTHPKLVSLVLNEIEEEGDSLKQLTKSVELILRRDSDE